MIHPPDYRPRRGAPAELWADGVYESAPVGLAMDIINRHDGATLNESDLSRWLDEIYISAWGQDWRRAVTYHHRIFSSRFLGFTLPFDDREALATDFDKLFDGTEGILESDKPAYADALNSGTGQAGRLLGSQYLIPLPYYAAGLGSYDRELRVTVIDGDYCPHSGLGKIHGRSGAGYLPGEIL